MHRGQAAQEAQEGAFLLSRSARVWVALAEAEFGRLSSTLREAPSGRCEANAGGLRQDEANAPRSARAGAAGSTSLRHESTLGYGRVDAGIEELALELHSA